MVLSSCQPSTPTPKEGCMCFQRDVCLIWPQNLVYRKRVVFLVCIPGDSDGEESACSARELGSVPGLGRSPGEGNGFPLQFSCPKNSMDREVEQATVHGATKSQIWLSNWQLFTLSVIPQGGHLQSSVKGQMTWFLQHMIEKNAMGEPVYFRQVWLWQRLRNNCLIVDGMIMELWFCVL